jgi:hypothetical protein
MPAGPWIDGPASSGTTSFEGGTYTAGTPVDLSADATIAVTGVVVSKTAQDDTGDGTDRSGEVWNVVRGFQDSSVNPNILVTSSRNPLASVGSDAHWPVGVDRGVRVGAVNEANAGLELLGFAVGFADVFSPTLPTGATGWQADPDQVAEWSGNLTFSYDTYSFDDGSQTFTGIVGSPVIAPLDISSIGLNGTFPYANYNALPSSPGSSLAFSGSGASYAADASIMPDYLLNSSPAALITNATHYWAVKVQLNVAWTYQLPRYRFLFPGAPPCRIYPRDDGLGVGAGRIFPPPTSHQRSGRRAGGYY